MPDRKQRFENMLFNYETTARTDLRDGEIVPIIRTLYKAKPVCVGKRPAPLKYLHTLKNWKRPIVPSELYVKPKEIVRTNPWNVQQEYDKLPDLQKDQVKKTRPRLVMTPAISMDDIDDDRVRDMLLNDVYTTSAVKTMQEVIKGVPLSGLNVPCPKLPAPANPISLPKLNVPYVSPEWRRDSVTWDNRQLRTYSNSNRQFWLTVSPRCDVCKQTETRTAMNTMKLCPN